MSYFDHVRCHHCGAQLDPDRLAAAMRCPHCNGELSLKDLFGVADAYSEDESPNLSLDDLLAPGRNNPFAEDPLRRGQPAEARSAPRAGAARAPASPAAPPKKAPPRPALPGPAAAGMVHAPKPQDDDDDTPGGNVSALELMRRMKKRK